MDSIIQILSKYPEYGVFQDEKGIVYIRGIIKGLKCVVSYFNGNYGMVLNDTIIQVTKDSSAICLSLNKLEKENSGNGEWIFGSDHPKFTTAKNNVTKADVKFLQNLTQSSGGKAVSEDGARQMTAEIRWGNRICNKCMDKSDILKLFFCDKCYLVQYCSKYCLNTDSSEHQKRCCDPNGPLDDGPQCFAVAERKQCLRTSL